ncbi:MAG: DUF1800 domain-containing protein [Sphingomonadales bacterium]|nr:DUF1800 domain-containing protein [Sphingomonadales bacterium]MDE2168913.1 DUF1800 domain-containing protein [Sphingomonadales bacterium]
MTATAIALNRFGLGARPGDGPIDDPRRWLEDQFARYQPTIMQADLLATRTQVVQDLLDYRAAQRAFRIAKAAASAQAAGGQPSGMVSTGAPPQPGTMAMAPAMPTPPPLALTEPKSMVRDQHILQAGRRIRNAVATDTPFVEKMVHFWSNHFAISVDKMELVGLGGLMEFEAIRPHVLGRFEDMLVAVEQHPAMLLFLDQAQSVGPDSVVGTRASRNGRGNVGLNENLAREIMELHTLGVRSGYTQADVTEFARALTGWTVTGIGRGGLPRPLTDPLPVGSFVFAPMLHQPGERTILGKRYDQQGEAQARAILADFARSPATANHIATKLARHFVADDPPPSLVNRLAKAYRNSNGDLPTVYRALISAKEAWTPTPAKFRDPWNWSIAMYRALGSDRSDKFAAAPDRNLVGAFVELGQPIWRPGSPAGFDDIAGSWAAPDALLRRVELASRIAAQAPATLDPRALAGRVLGDSLSPATAATIASAESPREGLSLMLVSPEMLRC